MTDAEILTKVKTCLGMTTDDEDVNAQLSLKIKAVTLYLIDGGADITNVNITDKDIACVAMGVNDLLNNNSGTTSFSPAFDIIAKQICGGVHATPV